MISANKIPKIEEIDLEIRFYNDLILLFQSRIDKLNESKQVLINAEKSNIPLWNSQNIKWTVAHGPKGEFEIATLTNNPGNQDFELLKDDLLKHDRKFRYEKSFFWMLEDNAIGKKVI